MKIKLNAASMKTFLKFYAKPIALSIVIGAACTGLVDAGMDIGIHKGVNAMFRFIDAAGIRGQFDAYVAETHPELCEKDKEDT